MKSIVKKYIKSFMIGAIFIFACNMLSVLHPYIVKQIVDVDFSANSVNKVLFNLFAIYFLIHIILVFMKYVKYIYINKLMARLLKDIREKLFCKVLKFKMKTFNKYNSSQIYTRLTSDTDNLFNLFFGVLDILVDNVLYIALMVAMMFLANINLAIIGCATVLVVAFVCLKFTKKLKTLDNGILEERDKENKEFSEMYNKNKLTYLFGLQKKNIENVNKLFDEELKYRKKYIFTENFVLPLALVLEAIGIYAILYYALNINLSISLGDIYLVLFYIKQCRSPLSHIFDELEQIQTCLNSLKRVNVILNEKDDENLDKGKDVKLLDGDIEFRNVFMRYEDNLVLKNVSFIIKKGSKVTIAGRTGAGKTTLTNVFMRLYDIEDGQILIDGQDISEVSIKSLRENISYISQNPYIFEDTLRNNITLGNTTITDDEILDIIKEMNVQNIYSRFSNGLDEKIKDTKLSYGELQVIAFIRAISHKSSIYIFDEPTSNIDLKTEKLIQNLIDKISENSTVIIVAHRKSTIESSDKIIYLKNGQVDMIVNKESILA
ncbi:MAG: ABC transporter ATP-binding protein [Clostridia bacterium]|nr:ABC transporter ATP-binding protein [Clostridia bacterium]